jgi:pyrroline-5-carboxylate reductase
VNETGAAPATIVLVGAGKMGFALLKGWARRGVAAQGVSVIEPHPSPQLIELCKTHGFRLAPAGEVEAPEALVLAIKPQMLEAVSPSLDRLLGPQTFLLSILAGKRVADIELRAPKARAIVRAMPNTPAAVGRGVTGAYASEQVSARQREQAQSLLTAVGSVEWLEREELIDAVTAVSGSGPAYVFYFVEALAKAGTAVGLPRDLAGRLARATVEGAGELLHQSPDVAPETLRQNVTSPGGTTAAALEALMGKDGLEPLLQRAVEAARRRAEELSG